VRIEEIIMSKAAEGLVWICRIYIFVMYFATIPIFNYVLIYRLRFDEDL
jgi:hypothetical protein